MLRDQLAESRDIRELGIIVVGNKRDLLPEDGRDTRDYASAVRKHWKAPYIEVSAKFNWHVVTTFKEILLNFQEARGHKDLRPHNLQELHEVIEHSKCTIL
ncbi:UNVERIFIED_CONTAM: hypothetical protein RMT77_009870 [Armadillidium vulgare]